MKVNFFMLFITLALCGLIFFGFYKWTNYDVLYTWVSSVTALCFLTPVLALKSDDSPRSMTMTKVFSSVVLVIMLIVNILFVKYQVSDTAFIIVNGVVLCIWAGMFYGMTRTKQ